MIFDLSAAIEHGVKSTQAVKSPFTVQVSKYALQLIKLNVLTPPLEALAQVLVTQLSPAEFLVQVLK